MLLSLAAWSAAAPAIDIHIIEATEGGRAAWPGRSALAHATETPLGCIGLCFNHAISCPVSYVCHIQSGRASRAVPRRVRAQKVVQRDAGGDNPGITCFD